MDSYQPRTPDIMKIKELDRDILTQYSCDEIQLVRQQAQSATPNEISFNMKMPDASAILHSTVWMKVRARFSMDLRTDNIGSTRATWDSYDERRLGAHIASDHIMLPGGICPIQAKLFDNVSLSINGVSFQARASEILEPICRMTVPNKIASKINLPYPDYYTKKVASSVRKGFFDDAAVGPSRQYVPGDYEWKAAEKWRKQAVAQGADGQFQSHGGGQDNSALSPWIEFWEPLCLACFSPLAQTMECKTLPDWHPWRMQGVGIPNCNRLVINAQLGQNFAGNMCLAVSRGAHNTASWTTNAGQGFQCGSRNISLAAIEGVELFATVYKPPQLWVGASQSSYVIPTFAVERWEESIPNGELAAGAQETVPLSYHNFDRMPGAFIIFCGPDRASKWSRIAGSDYDNPVGAGNLAASTDVAAGWKDKLMSSRMDKFLSIKELRLSINTRSDAFVSTRGEQVTFDKMQLYHMSVRNSRRYNLGYSEFEHDMESWYENVGIVILTVDDISAAIPSANVTSRVNIHGSVVVENNLGYQVNGGDIGAAAGFGNTGGANLPQERYSLFAYGVFNNRALVLTQISGEPMTEILPASFATELKLGGRAQYVGRV